MKHLQNGKNINKKTKSCKKGNVYVQSKKKNCNL